MFIYSVASLTWSWVDCADLFGKYCAEGEGEGVVAGIGARYATQQALVLSTAVLKKNQYGVSRPSKYFKNNIIM